MSLSSISNEEINAYHCILSAEVERLQKHDIEAPTLEEAYNKCKDLMSRSDFEEAVRKLIESNLVLKLELNGEERYATRHAELIRALVDIVSIRPGEGVILEWRVLASEEAIPNFKAHSVGELKPYITEYLQRIFEEKAEGQRIKNLLKKMGVKKEKVEEMTEKEAAKEAAKRVADAIIEGLSLVYDGLSEYQFKYLTRIFHQEEHPWAAVITGPTGCGKTAIFAIYAIVRAVAEKLLGRRERPYVLLVYPRKALASDQLKRLAVLAVAVGYTLRKHRILEGVPIRLGIFDGDSASIRKGGRLVRYRGQRREEVGTGEKVRGISEEQPQSKSRSKAVVIRKCEYKLDGSKGRVLCKVEVRESSTQKHKYLRIWDLVTDVREDIARKPPELLLTNMWMLHHALRAEKRGKRDIREVLLRAPVIVVDEAHAYRHEQQVVTAEILYNYYLHQTLEHVGRIASLDCKDASRVNACSELIHREIKQYMAEIEAAIVLSSATITSERNEEIFRKHALAFAKYILSPGIFSKIGEQNIIVENYYTILSRQNSENAKHVKKKLDVYLILLPAVNYSYETLMQETLLTALTWAYSTKLLTGGRYAPQLIAFYDDKQILLRVHNYVTNVIVRERCEHCDHLGYPITAESVLEKLCSKLGIGKCEVTCPTSLSDSTLLAKNAWRQYLASTLAAVATFMGKQIREEKVNTIADFVEKMKLGNMEARRFISSFVEATKGLRELWFTFVAGNSSSLSELAKFALETSLGLCKQAAENKLVDIHHADLPIGSRVQIEQKFKNKELLALNSTSTLELGIDIGSVSVVLQCRPPSQAESFVQRVGRAGRSRDSLYTSLGILTLSHLDVTYIVQPSKLLTFHPIEPPYSNFRLQASGYLDILHQYYVHTSSTEDICSFLLDPTVQVKVESTFRDMLREYTQQAVINYVNKNVLVRVCRGAAALIPPELKKKLQLLSPIKDLIIDYLVIRVLGEFNEKIIGKEKMRRAIAAIEREEEIGVEHSMSASDSTSISTSKLLDELEKEIEKLRKLLKEIGEVPELSKLVSEYEGMQEESPPLEVELLHSLIQAYALYELYECIAMKALHDVRDLLAGIEDQERLREVLKKVSDIKLQLQKLLKEEFDIEELSLDMLDGVEDLRETLGNIIRKLSELRLEASSKIVGEDFRDAVERLTKIASMLLQCISR